ncbi:MAG: deoxyuridine 5-triphosphate nucleotidohydrolase, dUTP pyrophosphatase [Candidatus Berkelbacteria bacterium]|nr:deoxyuridine 5-triphosphate nucleotidohydrolase, dUTP pyrophosphatase [Candidatus Berkelbacteria bacterium]
MIIKFLKTKKEAKLPRYAHTGDAGLDLFSIEDKILNPQEKYVFNTGIAGQIPEKFVGLIWERSGLATRDGLISLGGVIDSGYRGEIGVGLWNLSKKKVKINQGDRIAQLLIQPIINIQVKESIKLAESKRGQKGFGSTGRK